MKHILITGGSDGLGTYLASGLTMHGYHVTILGRNEKKTQAVASEIGCEYVVADVRDFDAISKVCGTVVPIDILINNAGVWSEGPYDQESEEDITTTMMVNALGTMYVTRVVLPSMLKKGSGEIINIISRAGLTHKPDRGTYGASKWAITGFTYNLRDELELKGIKVTGIYPATFNTKLFEKSGISRNMDKAMSLADVGDPIIQHILDDAPATDIRIQTK